MVKLLVLFSVVALFFLSGCERPKEQVFWCEYKEGDRVLVRVRDDWAPEPARVYRVYVDTNTMLVDKSDRGCWYVVSFENPHIQPNEVRVHQRRVL